MTELVTDIPDRTEILAALERISGLVRTTPVLAIDGSELGFDGSITLKLELMQHSGTFKARGASNFVLANTVGDAGLVAASGGNHGAAVAWVAQVTGTNATIFVPEITSEAKLDRLRSFGADVRQVGAVYAEALEASQQFVNETGATPIHAYEDRDVVAGAATLMAEFTQQLATQTGARLDARLDQVLIACGGGGLVGGAAAWVAEESDRPTIVACETEDTACYSTAKLAGLPTKVDVKGIAADALGATMIGDIAFRALKRVDAASVVIDDAAVVAAQQWLWRHLRLLVEPAAAVPVGAILSKKWVPQPGAHVGIVICGANVDPTKVAV